MVVVLGPDGARPSYVHTYIIKFSIYFYYKFVF
jgi:hypothetical protein